MEGWTDAEVHRYRHDLGLHEAISRGDVKAVRRSLDDGADITCKLVGVFQRTPITRAMRMPHPESGSLDVLRLLIGCLSERGVQIDGVTISDSSLLMNAVTVGTYGSLAVAEMLLDCGASADWATQNGKTALCVACDHGNVNAVRLLISRGATVDRRSYDVVKSASYSRVATIKAFFDAAAPPSKRRLAHWVLRIRLHVAGPRGGHPDSARHETFSCRTQSSRAIVRRVTSFVA
jgi:ankyrin repeat protein